MTQETSVTAAPLAGTMASEVLLARMDERLKNLAEKVDHIAVSIEARKTPWWQIWGPVAFFLTLLGGVYGKFENDVRALQNADAQSVQQRSEINRRLERLEQR